MIIYNISTQVIWAIHDRWKEWLFSEYLPSFMSTGLFSRYQVTKLVEADEAAGPTYAVQFYLENNMQLTLFRSEHLLNLQQREKMLWGENAFSFATVMEVIN